MKRHILWMWAIVCTTSATFLFSCSKDDAPEADPTSGLHKISGGYATGSGLTVDVYSASPNVYTGYQRLSFLIKDSITGQVITETPITLHPMMDMGMMQHASPYENPAPVAINKLFKGSVVFIMPSTGGTWTLGVRVTHPVTGNTGTYSGTINVIEPTESKMKSFTSAFNGERYFVALIDPEQPKIGINDFEVAVYKRANMMSFPADSTLSVIHTPEMPTMGHGSPNNVQPVHMGKGHYKGKVNFTMSGFWRVHMDYMHGTEVADTTQYFDITF
ncbi:MAG TPA: FixH family protein [Ferruginibacter sp.]|nr:FixH family protein [Ferruginibacter sp.]HRO17390.1 FixH family protein [Ferruginibacter sp.]HRQ20081.1 FixH family protein [Ferruginibacter sp.]